MGKYLIEKILNDGKHLNQSNKVVTFFTDKGYRTPRMIWRGFSDGGIEICMPTKREAIAAIERDNRLFRCVTTEVLL